MFEGTLWRGRDMGKPAKRRPTEILFSPLSLLVLFFVWIGLSALAFYVGILVGRMEQIREIESAYRADERAMAEEELPFLSFEESLTAPDPREGAEGLPAPSKSRQPAPPPPASGESGGAEVVLLQIASFREPERAEAVVQELRRKGYQSFHRAPEPSEAVPGYCRVFVGPLPSAEMARAVKAQLERQEGYKDILIRSVERKEEQP